MALLPSGNPVTNTVPRVPFDDNDADIIFRSSDDIDFRLYRVILAKASPVFRTMLQLPQPSSTPAAIPSASNEPHVVTVTEDAKTLENRLRLRYPIEDPNLTVDDVQSVLEGARKYEIASVATNLRWVLMHILPVTNNSSNSLDSLSALDPT